MIWANLQITGRAGDFSNLISFGVFSIKLAKKRGWIEKCPTPAAI